MDSDVVDPSYLQVESIAERQNDGALVFQERGESSSTINRDSSLLDSDVANASIAMCNPGATRLPI